MLILLPPSEGKATHGGGAPLDLAALGLPELTEPRATVLGALVELCGGGDPDKAMEALGLGPGLCGEVERNAGLRTAATLPAGELYTGVLYDALDLATLDAGARGRAERSLLVFSGLWGVLRPTDRVPPYRCSMGARLPGVGALPAFWRPRLGAAVPVAAGDGLVLDLRSTAYAAAWKPAGELAERTATVRVLHERLVDGVPRRTVVSHFNKATKGRLVRSLLADGAEPASPVELAVALRDLGYRVEEPAAPQAGPRRAGKVRQLDVVVSEL
ncbi:peroxide stress protein YaaA [Allostreptomyces psammosilenae]|uniref:Peroxide stress protein YaaA n=1 Tax=Allostreptomyces psammosilenae TaxID=1892865 RepID=A0A853A8Q6_9ACTN|nr:peroxide stress protein YaaA [Allostreptomyces psammosilenae]NYI06812.1 hypothetical protein [Allostreptomyces psammosilenae]